MGKSTLLTALTGTKSEAAAYEFTTLTCIPGVIHYNEAKIQLLDLPGIIEGAAEGKGAAPAAAPPQVRSCAAAHEPQGRAHWAATRERRPTAPSRRARLQQIIP